MVFLRNKELLREVGRRDFELGSDPVFPAERVEIVWEELNIMSRLHELWSERRTEIPKFSTSSVLILTAASVWRPQTRESLRCSGARSRGTRVQ